jgi:hypothetical protein
MDILRRALRAAIAAHRPQVLRHLVASHGERAVAAALAGGSGRVIADALSMLPPAERERVSGRLPRRLARMSPSSGTILAVSRK